MPMKRFLAILAAPAGLMLMGGCLATQEHVDDLRRQVNALNASLGVMQKNQADLNVKMDTLSRSLAQHSENLKDFDQQLGRVSAKLDDIETMFGNRISALGTTLAATREADRAKVDEANRKTAELSSAMLPSKTYSDAYALLLKKSYERAAQGFALYLEKFPSGELAESAYYYMGEAYWSVGNWHNSAVAYATVLKNYPSSQYTAAARLRYAQCLLKLGPANKPEAEQYLQFIIKDFPNTQQARLAQDYLNELRPPAAGAAPVKAKPAVRKKWRKPAAKSAAAAPAAAAAKSAAQ